MVRVLFWIIPFLGFFLVVGLTCLLSRQTEIKLLWTEPEMASLLHHARQVLDGKPSKLDAPLKQKLIDSEARITFYLFDDPKRTPVQSGTIPIGDDPQKTIQHTISELKHNEVMTRKLGGSPFLNHLMNLKRGAEAKRLYLVLSTSPKFIRGDLNTVVRHPDYHPHRHTLIVRKIKSIAITPVDVMFRHASRKAIANVLRQTMGVKINTTGELAAGIFHTTIFGEGVESGLISRKIPLRSPSP